jgi:hypothetical protein
VVMGHFKSFGYGRGRVKWMSALVLVVACNFLLIMSLMEKRNGVTLI